MPMRFDYAMKSFRGRRMGRFIRLSRAKRVLTKTSTGQAPHRGAE